MRFAELPKYKDNILLQLLTNDNLVKALSNNQRNFIDYDPSFLHLDPPKDKTSLLYTQIFPYRAVKSKIVDTKSYITMGFRFKANGSQQIKTGKIYFYIIIHESLVETDYGMRYDYILSEIDKIFNGSRGMGIGKLEFSESADDMPVPDGYVGSYVSYDITDFQ